MEYATLVVDQFIPLQAMTRSVLEYDVSFHGDQEIYAPRLPERLPPKFLALNYTPQAFGRAYCFSVKNAIVSGVNVIDPANPGRLFMETLPDMLRVEGREWNISTRQRRRIVRRSSTSSRVQGDAYIFGTQLDWRNYYHFVIDGVAKYSDLVTHDRLPKDARILIPSSPNRWQQEYLDLLGLDSDQVLPVPGNQENPLRIDRLLVASPTRMRRAVRQSAIHGLRHVLSGSMVDPEDRPERRIYISRRRAKSRRLLNEEELTGILKKHRFEICELEDMTVSDQIRLFSSASVIVGPHGAGFTNLVYAHRPMVIEFFPADRWNFGAFLTLTNVIAGSHVSLVAQEKEPASENIRGLRGPGDDNDYTIEPGELERVLDSL